MSIAAEKPDRDEELWWFNASSGAASSSKTVIFLEAFGP